MLEKSVFRWKGSSARSCITILCLTLPNLRILSSVEHNILLGKKIMAGIHFVPPWDQIHIWPEVLFLDCLKVWWLVSDIGIVKGCSEWLEIVGTPKTGWVEGWQKVFWLLIEKTVEKWRSGLGDTVVDIHMRAVADEEKLRDGSCSISDGCSIGLKLRLSYLAES